MNYQVVDKWNDMDFGGTGMVGSLTLHRDTILKKLDAEPIKVNGARILERWLIKFEDGTVATIFNESKDPNHWLVGGFGTYDKKTKENLSFRAVKQLFEL